MNLGTCDEELFGLTVCIMAIFLNHPVIPLTNLLNALVIVFANFLNLFLKALNELVQSLLHRDELKHQKRSKDTEVAISQQGINEGLH